MQSKYKISVLIPSRNEEFLALTVKNILENTGETTEVITVLDGAWTDPGIPDDKRLTIIYLPQSVGQRAATNLACKLSRAKYVIKTDAHVTFDKGLDEKMLEAFEKAGDNSVIVPIMRNLWMFSWKCFDCEWEKYQGPKPEKCEYCGGTNIKRKMVVIAKKSPQSVSYCFDSEPHFQYFKEYAKRPEYKKDLEETGLTKTMSLQGSFWMLTREKYWELNVCDDEKFGSWGSMGLEVAAKFWLSGGQVLVNHKTWYAHMFRTQKDFSFPYPQSGRQVQRAKHYAKDLFFNNKWEKQIYPLSWLLKKFWPINGWTEEDLKRQIEREQSKSQEKTLVNIVDSPSKGIIFYTANDLNLKIAHAVQNQLRRISKEKNIPIVSCSLKPMPHFGKNIHIPLPRGKFAYFTQILTALENSDAEIIFMAEHDVLYHPGHFDFVPPQKDKFYYNLNWQRVRLDDSKTRHWDANQVSMLCAYRKLLIEHYRQKIMEIEKNDSFGRSYEPAGRNKSLYETWQSEQPNIDIRHSGTMTKDKLSIADFRDKSTCVNWQEGDIKDLWCYNTLKKLTS